MDKPDKFTLRNDWIAVRELKQHHEGELGAGLDLVEDLNKKPFTVITGVIEQIGPGRWNKKRTARIPIDVKIGQTVWFGIEMGKARLPWDLDVRLMKEEDFCGVEEEPCSCSAYNELKDDYVPPADACIEKCLKCGRAIGIGMIPRDDGVDEC